MTLRPKKKLQRFSEIKSIWKLSDVKSIWKFKGW